MWLDEVIPSLEEIDSTRMHVEILATIHAFAYESELADGLEMVLARFAEAGAQRRQLLGNLGYVLPVLQAVQPALRYP